MSPETEMTKDELTSLFSKAEMNLSMPMNISKFNYRCEIM